MTLRPGIPFQVGSVAIDLLSPEPGEDFLAAALAAPSGSMIDAPHLIYMKLKSPRHKDRTDIIELLKSIDVERCREYVRTNAPHFMADFEDAVTRARAEE